MKKILFLLALLFPVAAHAQTGAFDGFCDQGGVSAVTSGLNSTNRLQGIIPYCTVTVYFTGTLTKATIYKDAINTPQTNPYQTLANGQILFFAATGVSYDVVMSGGIPPNIYASPITLTGISPGVGSVGSVISACGQIGADGGAKVNAALAALGGPGTVTIDLSCGTTWTTPVVTTSTGQFLQFLGGAFNLPSISLPFANDTIDGNNSTTLQMQAYSGASSTPLIQLYSGSNVGSNATIQNITIDGNTANTPTAEVCLTAACRPGLGIDNGGNSTGVHDIQVHNVTFQNFNGNPIAIGGPQGLGYSVPLHFPFPSNIYIDTSRFINNGVSNIYSTGWDRNLSITNNYFTGWGTGLTTSHANPITTIDLTGYSGTSQIGMNVTGNTFLQSVIQPDGYGFAGELGAGGLGWIKDFIWSNNKMWDGGSGDGPCLSGIFQNATITGNESTSWGFCEVTGTNIAITGNTLENGTISLNPGNGLYSTGNTITGNTISENGGAAPYTYAQAQRAITIGGGGLKTVALSKAIRQIAQSFNVGGNMLTFTPQTVAGTPPTVCIAGTFSGGASNGYQNWAFTLNDPTGATQGAHNLSNNGTFIISSSTDSSMCFVNPLGISETLPAAVRLVSSATTTSYVGTFYDQGAALYYGGFNGWIGQPGISVAGFSNAGNNTTALTATATAYSVSAGTVTITVPNNFVVGNPIVIIAPLKTDPLYSMNGNEYTVSATGLSASQVEIAGVSITGSGTTVAQLQGVGFTALANSNTALAVYNPNGVKETALATMPIAPAMANTVVASNSISFTESEPGAYVGMLVGLSDNTRGTFYNLGIFNNTISASAPWVFFPGIEFIANGSANAFPMSWGLDIKNNILSGLEIGVTGTSLSANGLNDITVESNKFAGVGVPIQTDSTLPSVYRAWDNVVSDLQTRQVLNGGALVDSSGDITSPGYVAGATYSPGTYGEISGTVAWSNAVAVNSAVLVGNVTSSTIGSGLFDGQQICFLIRNNSVLTPYTLVWPSNMEGMSPVTLYATYVSYQCAAWSQANSQWTATAPGIDNLGNVYLPGSAVNAGGLSVNSIIDRGLTPSTSPICPNGTGGAFTTSGCVGGSGSGTVSGQAAGVIPLPSGATAITAQSHLDDGVTTAATITSSEPIAAPSFNTLPLAYYSSPDSISIGFLALPASASGSDNVALGTYALGSTVDGSEDVAIGWESMLSVISGSNNVAIGFSAASTGTAINNVVAIGAGSLLSSTGSGNTAVGSDTAIALTTNSNSTFVGYSTLPAANSGDTNETVIGYGATGKGSNTVTLGNGSVAAIYLGGITMPLVIYSDAGTQLAACSSTTVGGEAVVSDAAALVPGTAYSVTAGAGSDTVRVQCTHVGSTYAWQTM